jgi:hypothetical protein
MTIDPGNPWTPTVSRALIFRNTRLARDPEANIARDSKRLAREKNRDRETGMRE